MKSAPQRVGTFASALMALALVASACSGGDDKTADGAGGNKGTDGGGLGGEVIVTGSSTVEPISAANVEKFGAENDAVAISVDGPGTGDGFEIFCSGEADIADASRPIKEEEIQACADNGIEFVELFIGRDALSVITSPDNDAVECLSFLDLYALLGPEAEGSTWSDADDLAGDIEGALEGKFGASHAPYPDEDLVVTAPGEESGTYDSFVELAFDKIAEERGVDGAARPDYQASPNDNVIIEGVGGSSSSLGWVGFAFVKDNLDTVKAIEVDGGDGCVAPSDETVNDGTYPLSRGLLIYVNKAKAEENAALSAFVDFYLSDEGLASVTEVGYVAMTDEEITATRATWDAKTTGTHET